jgi:hypothetical protein
MWATNAQATALAMVASKSFASLRPRPSHAKVRSTTVDLLVSVLDVNLDPVAIELDLMEPLFTGRRPGLQGSQLGFYEPRHFETVRYA